MGEALQAEIVEDGDTPSGRRLDLVKHEEAAPTAAIEAAAHAALTNPGAPGAQEFMALAAQARLLSLSGAAPKAIRENPYVAFHVALIGRDFGLSVAAAAELVDVIDSGAGPRISLSPQLLNGQIRRLGLGSIIPVLRRPDLCVAAALAPNGEYDERCKAGWPEHRDDCRCRGILGTSSFGWEDARMAGLVGAECEPGEHKVKTVTKNGRSWQTCGCNQGYKTYPTRMMWWRAGGFAGDDYFPEASLGLYSPEALGVPVDEEGRPIDPATAELPPGYEPAPDPRATAKAEREKAMEEPADQLDLLDLQIRVAALPGEQRAMLAEKWKENDRLAGRRLDALPAPLVRFAAALIGGFEAAARSATKDADHPWVPSEARAVVVSALAALAPEAPQEAPAPEEGDRDPAGEEQPPQEAPGTASDGLPADPEFDVDPTEEKPEKPRQQHADDDEALQRVLARTKAVVEAAPDALVAEIVAEVKAMHHTKVDEICRAHDIDPTGRHIDTRRMMVCAWIVEERQQGESS